MRIAIFSHFYPPTHNAGAEQYTHGLARQLIAAGHEARVLCAGSWDEGETYLKDVENGEWEGVPVRRLHLNWTQAPDPNGYLIDNPVVYEEASRFLSEFHPDVAHITSLYTLSTSAIQALHDHKVPSIFTLTDYWIICPRHTLVRGDGSLCDGRVSAETCQDCMLHGSRPYNAIKGVVGGALSSKLASIASQVPVISKQRGFRGMALDVQHRRDLLRQRLPYITHVVAPSQYVADQCSDAGVPDGIKRRPHGFNLDWTKNFQPIPRQQGVIRLGYIGQIMPLKGVDVMVRELVNADLGSAMPLTIYGKLDQNPVYADEVRAVIGDRQHIRLAGPYLRTQLGEVLAGIDALVVPSVWPENAPLVIQEAFAVGIPVIASKLGGIPEFIRHEVNGLLFDPLTPGSLQKTLETLHHGGHALLDHLRAGIPPVLSIEEELQALLILYDDAIQRQQ